VRSREIASSGAVIIRPALVAAAGLALALLVGRLSAAPGLPASLTDTEFWTVIEEFSEPNGYFNSDNLLSNETTFQYVIPKLVATVKPGTAYLGVGPEQNFTYILAFQPGIAFVPDIRRGNLQEHLFYKALIEMAADRAEFLSLLFARPHPADLSVDATVERLMAAYSRTRPDDALYRRTLDRIAQRLKVQHGFKLHHDDLEGIEYIYSEFRAAGPSLSYNSARPQRMPYPTYSELQRETDGQGQLRGYLASEASFKALKRYEERNLIVPLVGDFAGPKTIRSVGTYLKQHNAVLGAFYTSNVENYLFQNGNWAAFAMNVSTLPIDGSSTFIRACFDACGGAGGSRSTTLLDPISVLLKDFRDGKVRSYWDVLANSRQ
jgi:hypothetical protein